LPRLRRRDEGLGVIAKIKVNMRILIIEDDHKIANAVKRGLEQESFAVDVAYEAKEGLGSAASIDYDAIILDRMLPGTTDGLQICKALRMQKIHTPILVLTAKDRISDRVEGLNTGADDYLIKPFAFSELLARVRALLRRPKNQTENILRVGQLELDTLTFKVSRLGQEINLSAKEFALLDYLMRNPGRIFTKDNIIAHVWNYDADVLPNTVEVYIGYLRNKIDRPFPKNEPMIETVRGFGYKISSSS
jgi:DNA-binding response OmpR family regulator